MRTCGDSNRAACRRQRYLSGRTRACTRRQAASTVCERPSTVAVDQFPAMFNLGATYRTRRGLLETGGVIGVLADFRTLFELLGTPVSRAVKKKTWLALRI